jgi:hypothetical protein
MTMDWQPISTAPDNYETVWVSDGKDVELARRMWSVNGPMDIWESREQWDNDGDTAMVSFNPTHWMSRPAPPK